jgi:HEAT repeat protein
MTTRRIILIGLGLFLVFGVVSFVWRSVQIRGELAKISSTDAPRQEEGARNLMARGALFDALQGGAPMQTRMNAIDALGRIAAKGDAPDAFNQLLQMLKDPDTESAEKKTHPVRDRARDTVALVGMRYLQPLLDAAKSPDGAIKDQSREAIKKIGYNPELAEAMAARLGDSALRAPFGDILSGFGPQTVPLVTPYLQPAELGKITKPEDLAKAKVELIETLGKYKAPVVTAQAKPEERARAPQHRAYVVDAIRAVIPFKDDVDPNVRRTVITSLSNIALPEGEAVLVAALNSTATDSDARQAAAGALGAIASPAANAAMVRALSDYDLRVATQAAAGLKRAGDRATGAIAGALADPSPAVRALAADAAGGLSSTALTARALADSDPRVRARAAEALGTIGGASAVAPLLNALGDADGTTATAAVLALSRIGAPAIGPLVARLQAGGDDTVAYRVSQALGMIGRPAVDPLLAAAQNGKPGARWAAITLGQIGDPRATPALQALSGSPDPDTANAASEALARVKQG